METTVTIKQLGTDIECVCWVVDGGIDESVNHAHRQFNLIKVFADGVDITGYAHRFKDLKKIDCAEQGEYIILDNHKCPQQVDALFENDYDYNKLYEEAKEMCFN